jgi:hypothetical protein
MLTVLQVLKSKILSGFCECGGFLQAMLREVQSLPYVKGRKHSETLNERGMSSHMYHDIIHVRKNVQG